MEEMSGGSINSWLIRLMHCYSSVNFKKFTALGIHPGQLPVMNCIYRKEGISLRALADAIHIKPPTVTVTVQRLEKSGLVYKKADPADQRISRIYMTEKGKNIQREMIHLIDENERILIQDFSEEELEMLRRFLERMVNNLRQDGGSPKHEE
ncbi:MAG: MarR family transcriptional regulator [Lachnospiraceae bacterium]|nr:MarR family transcriptional regulator [Lachnospiraceae bacterium]